jgi:putative endopeptidase
MMAPSQGSEVIASSEIPERREFPVNKSINPCQDFYGYTCSLVNQSFKLREDRSRHTFAFNDSAERILEAKKKFLAGLGEATNLTPRGNTLKTIFKACMNEEASRAEEKKLVEAVQKSVLANDTHREFQKFVASKILSSDLSFLGFDNIANHDDPDTFDLIIMADLQTLPERSYYDKPEVYGDFEALVTDFFKTLGFKDFAARAKSVVQFEKEFAQTYPLPVEFRELYSTKTGISRAELQKRYPSFMLTELLKEIPETTHIRNMTPDNFEFLSRALEQTPVDTLKNVYLFNAASPYMDDAFPAYFQKQFDFRKKHLGGPDKRPDRNERCTKLVMSRFEKELDAEMLPLLFPHFPEAKIVSLAERVRSSIVTGIESNKWLTAESKAAAIKKIRTARLQLVKPKREKDWDFNPKATYKEDQPYENIKNLNFALMKRTLSEFKEKRNRDKWSMGPLTVNAYYSPSDNKFVMPIGILQYPFYDPELPVEVNLAAVGMVVGHELGHGIDDKGSKYDHKGRLDKWMKDEDLEKFKVRGQKLIGQFEKIGHNGKLTLGENIGDLVGLTFAYNAAFPGGKGDVPSKQAFFTQYGRLWCTVERPKFREMLLKVGPHAMGDARVNQQVMHQPGFSEAFSCAPGSAMTLPESERVTIW